MSQELRRVAVIGGARIPFCRSNTLYADQSNLAMMTAALDALVARYGLEGKHVDEVVGGAVVTHAKDFNLAREALLNTKLAPSTPGITMMQACATSLQAAAGIGAKIAAGEIEAGIAVGSDTTSDPPIVFTKRFADRLKQMAAAKSTLGKIGAFKGLRPAELAPQPPSVAEPRTGLAMGEHCELMAKEWAISREAQDKLAYESHKKAAAAYADGFMDDLVSPFAGVFRDNNVRADIDLERLATLKPVFDRTATGTLTAANSTPLTDGAAAALVCSEHWARQNGLAPSAYLTCTQSAANNFAAGDGLLMAPTIAVSRLLERTGLTLQDFDFYEIHEAFAAQVLCTLAAWNDPAYCRNILGRDRVMGEIDPAKLNVKGSSVAVGHPFAATGARIIGVLAKLLSDKGSGRGLISVCTAGGMGVAAILEAA